MTLFRCARQGLSMLALAGIITACAHNKPVVPDEEPVVEIVREDIELRSDELYADYFPARTVEPAPAILLLGGSEGGLGTGARRDAMALRDEGYNVLQISYYRAPGQKENLEMVPLETFDRALDWLKQREEVQADKIGIYGTSKGAEAALIVASRHPEIEAIVAVVPSSVSWQGVNWAFDGRPPESSWSLDGAPYPALPYGAWDADLGLYSLYKNGLAARDEHPEAVIAVEKADAPMLLICGFADTLWPSCEMSQQIKTRMHEAGKKGVTILMYADAGHFAGGMPGEAPEVDEASEYGGTTQANYESQVDSWPRILDFLDEEL
ncbi:acyl-CoA thioester hydrolase/BAAT C-terminal domain-containing protein [Hyphomonas beringensis]|nr:acyl-CoA thioester hydrolase/BAAT C-terminal domain-containing protein [Hyphomonas beringensis]